MARVAVAAYIQPPGAAGTAGNIQTAATTAAAEGRAGRTEPAAGRAGGTEPAAAAVPKNGPGQRRGRSSRLQVMSLWNIGFQIARR